MDKPMYIGLSILDISKIAKYKYWYDYVKPRYGNNSRLCYMDLDSFKVHLTKTSMPTLLKMLRKNLTHPTVNSKDYYPKEKQKRIRLMKDEFGEKITKGFVDLRLKTYSYLTDGGCISKNANSTKKCVIKQKINFEDCQKYLTI